MNKTQARRKWGEAYGSWYWANAHRNCTGAHGGKPRPEWSDGCSLRKEKPERVALILEIRKYRALMKTAPPEQDERGNTIYRDEDAVAYLKIPDRQRGDDDRYRYDFNHLTPAKGWKQYDTSQDAWYFGVWVNISQRLIFTYAEGDRTLTVCPDDDHLRAELKDIAEFYGAPPPAFICFSEPEPGKWVREEVYDTRPSL